MRGKIEEKKNVMRKIFWWPFRETQFSMLPMDLKKQGHKDKTL